MISANINSSSSEGPTDDLRIKPDITGNGTLLYSTNVGNDNEYYYSSGTSMASPNIAGSLLLLQEHWYNLNTNYLKSATLKGLVLHTADDLGTDGPDAIYGWGLMNAKKAAQVISSKGNESKIEELTLNSGSSYTFTVDSDGINPLIASISWTDRPGTATTTLNSPSPVLINDLDIRVSKSGTTFYPFRLQSVTSTGTGDNIVDPFELINVDNASGTYTITVSHKGSLVGDSQNYSLIVTGISNLKISGPDLICSGPSYTYTLQNPPSSVTWNTGSEVTVISQTNTSITIQASGVNVRGESFIEVNGGSVRKDFYVGKPYANLPQAPNICTNGFSEPYALPESLGATSYRLKSSSPNLDINGQNEVTFTNAPVYQIYFTSSSPGTYLVELFTTNGCGTSRGAMYVTSESCGGPGGFRISPNPSSSEITIKSTKR